MAKGENVFFVGIKDPDDLRRNVLETARGAIQTLQLFEKFRNIRDEKIKAINQLKSDLREVTRLVSKLKTALPKAKLRVKLHEHERLKGGKAKRKKKPKEVVVEGAAKGELEKLEEELSAIEGKLGGLG
ncbi:hypothetical protein KY361_00940 [Candidatus Woesearchaeota archaeon]|nr:hypothetical protein [Candidatus Woesearchaeota archaeon]